MKKIISILFTIILLFVSACSSDDETQSLGSSAGNYLPLAVNNNWNYLKVNENSENEITIVSTNQFNGVIYYKFVESDEANLNISQWFAKRGATYFLRTGDVTVNESGITITVEGYELPILKDDYEVNKSWTGTVSPKVTFSSNGQSGQLPFKVNYSGVNFYKGEVVLNGTTYPNVIKTRVTVVIDANDQITNALEEYWYAENIGIIKTISTVNGDLVEEKNINTYSLN